MHQLKVAVVLISFCAVGVMAQDEGGPRRPGFPRWSPQVQGGAVNQFDASLDGEGSFSVSRWFVTGGMARMWRYDRLVALSVGGGRDRYDFSGTPAPWDTVENLRATLFSRWKLNDQWSLFGGPSLRAYAEEGADWNDAWTPAVFAGASYTFSDRLKLGPGFGVVGRLEESVLVFPVLIVDWKMTDQLSLSTGGGLASTAGPGLSLVYKIDKKWACSLAGRYDSRRFRLNKENSASKGVGEDEGFGLYGNIFYNIYPRGRVSLIFGVLFDGKIEKEREDGHNVYSRDYKNAVSGGLTFSFDL